MKRKNSFDEDDADTIITTAKEIIEEMADADIAMAWSTPGDADFERFGDDVIFWAEFGWVNAVNGDIVWHKGHPKNGLGGSSDVKIPKGYVEVSGGGKVYSQEAEIDKEHVVDAVMQRTERQFFLHDVERVIDKEFKEQMIYWGSSDGEVTQYAKRKKKK